MRRHSPAGCIGVAVATVACCAALTLGPVLADDAEWLPGDNSATAAVARLPPVQADSGVRQTSASEPATGAVGPYSLGAILAGGSSALPGPLNLAAVCDDCPKRGLVAFVGYDSWRGISDGSWQNNGIHAGFNFGTRLGAISDWTGIGFQVGGSAGAFDWSGSAYRPTNQNAAETQGFVTYGFFRKANETSRWSAAVVQDWMLNDHFGQYSQNPELSQWRGQLSYSISARNEFGVWGTLHGPSANRNIPDEGPTAWRAIDQLNLFWHHKWTPGGADTSIWIGVPQRDRLTGDGSLGDYLAGASANVPLNNAVALYTLVTYMHPSAHPGTIGATEDAWNFTVGVAFYPARNARSSTVAGQCWMPLLPVANNGYFLVDTNQTD